MSDMVRDCGQCGESLQEDWSFCCKCGSPVPSPSAQGADGCGGALGHQPFFHSVFDSAHLGVIVMDKTGCIKEANRAFQKMTGHDVTSSPKTNYLDLVHPYCAQLNRKYVGDILHGKESQFSIETRLLRRDCSFFWARIYAMSVRCGSHESIVALVADISRQKEAESDVRHLNAVASSIHDTALDIMNRLDYVDLLEAIVKRAVKLARAEDGYIYILNEENNTLEMKIGVGRYEKAKMFQVHMDKGFGGKVLRAGQPVILDNYSEWPESLPDSVFRNLRAAMGIPLKSGNQVTGVITISSDEDDRTFTHEEVLLLDRFASLASIALDNARLVTALKQEIVERIRTEEALYESTELVRTILESVKDFIYVKDRNLKYLFANPVVANFLGESCESIIGKKDAELYPPEVANRAAVVDQRVLSGEIVSEEIQINMKSESHIFEYIKVPLKDKDGKVMSLCGISRDITERKKAEAAMFEAKEAVARAEKLASLGAMAAGITHEINQPLNSIKISATGILYWYKHKKRRPIEDIMEEVEEISSMADRIDRIIKHMRSLARSRESLGLGPCDLNKVVEQALDFVGSQLAAHGIKVRPCLNSGLPLVLGTPTGLEEAVINLLVNAMQALDPIEDDNKKISIRTDCDTHVVLEISDNGPGVEPEIRAKIFDPFFTTKGTVENMGFGLSIANSIVTSCGGKIRIISDGEHGTTFRMEFPVLDCVNDVKTEVSAGEHSTC